MNKMPNKYTLVAFTCSWGYTKGGINAFNTDFLEAMAATYLSKVNIVCVVLAATKEEIENAKEKNITLIPSYYQPESDATAQNVLDTITASEISIEAKNTIWLGHDRISGQIALLTAKRANGRSALIHHMSYDHYESFAENAQSANDKSKIQKSLFEQADITMAVGPLLRDALEDLIDKDVAMIIPGLAEIEPRKRVPNTFSMFVSGRLSQDSSRNKQGQLVVAAFANSYKQAKENSHPESLCKSPKLLLRGVDFDPNDPDTHYSSSEKELKRFAQTYADGVINLHPLPYTTDRSDLFNDLKASSVAAMPSWHEGFGLVAWEAIAAGVPLIISKDSGVYLFIKKYHSIFADGSLWAVDVEGEVDDPYFSDKDLNTVSQAILQVAKDPKIAREKALKLKEELSHYTWTSCAEKTVKIFGWNLQKGLVDEANITEISLKNAALPISQPIKVNGDNEIAGLSIAESTWRPEVGMATSVLLRASEEVVPFDKNRNPELEKLLTWAVETEYPLAIRLIKGEGGVGKTRLAGELCKNLKQQGWNAGFLKATNEILLPRLWANCQDSSKQNIFVIDYAETRADELVNLIKLIDATEAHKNTRILLLARDSGEWWDNLPAKDPDCENILFGSATTGPYTLAPLYPSIAQKKEGFQNALREFASLLAVETPTIVPDLTGEHFCNPLFIQMSALLALHGEQPKSSDGITRAVLNHEQRYWTAAFKSAQVIENVSLAKQLLALVTLAGNFPTAKEAFNYWQQLDDSAISQADFSKIFQSLVPLYPGYQGLQAVKPDLLGEELASQMLLSPSGSALLNTVLGRCASDRCHDHALTLLSRLSNYKPALLPVIEAALVKHLSHLVNNIITVAVETPSRLAELTAAALTKLKANEQSSIAAQLSKKIPDESLALNILACEADRILYEKVKIKANKNANFKKNQVQLECLSAILNYSRSLNIIGKNQEAYNLSKQTLEVGEFLHLKVIDKSESLYALFLSNHSNYLVELGRLTEAEKYAKQALEIRESLAKKNPDRYQTDFAASLNNSAAILSELGKAAEAQGYAKQALQIREELAQQDPNRYQPDFATSLSNNANRLSDLGEAAEAQGYAKQALQIREDIAKQNPDRHQPDFADSLSNYAHLLSELGNSSGALSYIKQALDIRENLAQQNPDKYAFDYGCNLLAHELLSWLFDQQDVYQQLSFEHLVNSMSEIELAQFELYKYFIAGTKSLEIQDQQTQFNNVLALQQGFSISQKVACEDYFHCACAWLYHKESLLPEQTESWLNEWGSYKEQRNNSIPKWMLSLADRLEFTFP